MTITITPIIGSKIKAICFGTATAAANGGQALRPFREAVSGSLHGLGGALRIADNNLCNLQRLSVQRRQNATLVFGGQALALGKKREDRGFATGERLHVWSGNFAITFHFFPLLNNI
jgi:hypothetical protein